jgi:hypothetical protein
MHVLHRESPEQWLRVLLSRAKCDRFHRDSAMLPMILRPIGIYTKVPETTIWLR